MQRSTQQRDSNQAVASNNCKQHNKRERKKERKGKEEKGVEEKSKKEERELDGKEERRGIEGERVARKEGKENEVEKDVTGWTEVTRNKRKKMVQIFVKMDGMKTVTMEVSPEDKVQKILKTVSKSNQDVYVTSSGIILKGSDKLKRCEVQDGSTVEVTSRMRGGGRHKDKKSKSETRWRTKERRRSKDDTHGRSAEVVGRTRRVSADH